MATLRKALRSAACSRRVRFDYWNIGGGSGGLAARWSRDGCCFPAAVFAHSRALLSTDGASLRKALQSSAKQSVAAKAPPTSTSTDAGILSKPVVSDGAKNPPQAAPVPAVMRDHSAGRQSRTGGGRESTSSDSSSSTSSASTQNEEKGENNWEEAIEDVQDPGAKEGSSRAPHASSLSDGSSRSDPAPSPLLPFHQGNYMEFASRITVVGCGGAGGNAVNNMISRNLKSVEFMVCNTDAQHLSTTLTDNRLQLGKSITGGLGCGANPDAGREAAIESKDEILERLDGSHMVFITAGMGGGTGTGAAPVIAEICMEAGILTVAVVTKPFLCEGTYRMRLADEGTRILSSAVDSIIVIPNQNLLKLASKNMCLPEAFSLANNVLLAGVRSVTDLMVNPGLINLDFADVQAVMAGMGNAVMGSGEAVGEGRAAKAAEDALYNPLLGEHSMKSAKGILVSITGGADLTLFEVDEAANRVTREVDDKNANIIFGATFDSALDGAMRVSVVATGIEENY